ncbi:hypothetical protein FQZ97_741270 [compost metagenome]
MAGVLLLDGHHRQAIRAAFRRQVEVGDFRELLLQDRHEHFVERHAEHRRLIRWTAGVGAVVDRLLPAGDALDGKHREAVDFVVVAGVVAVRAFVGHLAGMDHPFEDDLGAGRHLQLAAARLDQLGAVAAQQAGEGVFGEAVRHRGDRAEDGRRVGAEGHRHRVRLARKLLAPVAEIQGAAAMAEPAHDDLVATDHLLAVDAEVLPVLVGTLGDGQAPGDQRADVARPAGLHRQRRQVDGVALLDYFLARRILEHLGRHADDLLEDRQLGPGVLEALRRLRLLEEGQQLADLAQLADVLGAHAQRHALRRAEQVAEHRHIETRGILEQQRGAALAQGAVADFGHFQHRRYRRLDALEFAALFQRANEVAQVAILHARAS